MSGSPDPGMEPPEHHPEATEGSDAGHALYLYGIVDAIVRETYGEIGIEGASVECIPIGECSVIVHRCSPQPYESDDEGMVKGWVLAHQAVIDEAISRGYTVMPSRFDTIITPSGGRDAAEVLAEWVEEEYPSLLQTFEKIRGKQEYGIQIFIDRDMVAKEALQKNPTTERLERERHEVGPGTAFLLQRSIDVERARAIDSVTRSLYDDLLQRIRAVSDDIVVMETTPTGTDGQKMLMNLSCLVTDEQYTEMGDLLGDIDAEQGIHVRFTGPWPAYSFV